MSGTTPFPFLPFQSDKGLPIEKAQLEDHVSLAVILSCDSLSVQMELMYKLYAQFRETHKANFLFMDTCSISSRLFPDSLKAGMYILLCKDSLRSCGSIFDTWPLGKSYALIDRNGILRAYYAANTHDEKKTLVEHMALLIPRDYSEKVQLKRDLEKK